MKICLINNLLKLYQGWQKLYSDITAEELPRKNDFIDFTAARWFVTLEDTMEV